MLNFTIYTADCVGNSGNCLYPNKMIVTDKESFIKATKMDHVTAKYKGNYRSKDNFEYSDCIPLDCDFELELMLAVMDHITVFEDGRLQIKFYDGTEFEVETE